MSGACYRAVDPAVLWRAAAADREAFQLLARIYLDQAPPLLRTLLDSIATQRAPQAAAAAHALKGMAGLTGAAALSALLQRIEHAARGGETDAAVLAPLEQQCGAVQREIEHALTHYCGPESA